MKLKNFGRTFETDIINKNKKCLKIIVIELKNTNTFFRIFNFNNNKNLKIVLII